MALAAVTMIKKIPSPQLVRKALSTSPRPTRRAASPSPRPSPQPSPVPHRRQISTPAQGKVPMAAAAVATSLDDLTIPKICPVGSPAGKETLKSQDDSALDSLKKEDHLKSFDEMPHPKGLPIIGTLWDFMKKDGLKFNKMFEVMQSRANEFGPIYKEHIGHMTSVVVSDPEEYGKVIRADGKYPHRIEMEPMVHYRNKKGISLGTVNSQGEEWYRHRTVLSKKLLKPKEVIAHVPSMDEVGTDFMKELHKIRPSDGIIENLEYQIFKWSMESIGTVLFENRIGCFGDPPSKLAEEFIVNLIGLFKTMQPLMYNVPLYKMIATPVWKSYEAYTDTVMGIAMGLVNKRVEELKKEVESGKIEDRENSSFLTYLLSQSSLTPEEVNHHTVDLLMGAVETTSTASIWTLYCLSTHPEAQKALYNETVKVLGKDGPVTSENLPKLPYVKACLKEMFRLYPITFATSRIIPKEIEVGGYKVPAGSHLQANLYGMGRDPNLFEEPETFRPERWLTKTENSANHAMASLPFGHGARMCIGRRFAEQEIYIVLTKIIQNFHIEYAGEPLNPVLNTVMTPDRKVKIKFTPRHQ